MLYGPRPTKELQEHGKTGDEEGDIWPKYTDKTVNKNISKQAPNGDTRINNYNKKKTVQSVAETPKIYDIQDGDRCKEQVKAG